MVKQRLHSFLRHHHITKHMVKVYVALFTIMMSGSLSITLIYPYLPFMVKFLLPDIEDRNIGRYAGFLASSMYFGRFCGSYFWGWVADARSKKTILMYSGICMAFSSFFFGFSVNFYMAVIFRVLTGLSNGVVGNCRAIVYEHSDDVNKGFGMSLISTAFNSALVLGPAASGVLADPLGQYNLPPNSFLEKFPYCLPSMFAALLCLIGVIVTGCFLPDKPECTGKECTSNSQTDDNDSIISMMDTIIDSHYSHCEHDAGSDDGPPVVDQLLVNTSVNEPLSGDVVDENNIEEDTVIMDVFSMDEGETVVVKQSIRLKQKIVSALQVLLNLLKDKAAFGAVFLMGLFSFFSIGFDECYSLWSSTDRSLGGLGFSLNNIGVTLAIAGVMSVPLSLTIYNIMDKRIGTLMTYQINASIMIILVVLFPSMTYISENHFLLWIVLIVIMVIIRTTFSNCFICQGLFVSNSVTPDKLGAINGLGIAVTSLFRTFSPVVFGSIYSLSLSDTTQRIGFPVDFHLIFILFSFGFLLTMVLVASFPKRLEKQRKSSAPT
ncbi:uncharacterized protein [Dysidea avara]